jgi:hypothetical protein
MRWKNPSPEVQNILAAAIAIPVCIILIPALLAAFVIVWPIERYRQWSQSRGWHRWFAWHPVYCGDPWEDDRPRKWVWLEIVSRHTWQYGSTDYRWPEQVPE